MTAEASIRQTAVPALDVAAARAGSRSFVASVFGLSAVAVSIKAFGFIEKLVIARFFGTGDTADVYFAVTGIVLSLVWLVRELVSPALLPTFTETLRRGPVHSEALFRRAFLSVAAGAALLMLLLVAFHRPLIRILLPGFAGAKQQMASELLCMLGPAVLVLSLTMVSCTVLNARKQFMRAALPEALYKLAVVLGLLVLIPSLGILSLAWIMTLAGLGCLFLQMASIPQCRALLRKPAGTAASDAFHRMLLLMGPLVVGVLFSHVNGLIDNVLASMLPDGQLSYLGYAKKLIDALLLVGPVALVTVAYSHLAHLWSAQQHEEFTAVLTRVLRLLLYLTVPAGCMLVALREPLIRLFFQRGQFGSLSSSGTAQAFLVYAAGLPVFALEAFLVHSFFARSDTRTPVKLGIACGVLDIVLALLLLGPLEYLGIAWAYLVARTAKMIGLAVLLHRKSPGIFGPALAGFLVRLFACNVVTCGALWLLCDENVEGSAARVALRGVLLPALGRGGLRGQFPASSHRGIPSRYRPDSLEKTGSCFFP